MKNFYLTASAIFCDAAFVLYGSFFMLYGGLDILKIAKKYKFKLVK